MATRQTTKSLKQTGNQLADTFFQLKVLGDSERLNDGLTSFESRLKNTGYRDLRPASLEILQINIGKLCNQTCAHCHVDAGPDRKNEIMSRSTLEKCLKIIEENQIKTVDITGGAPEMNPHFRWLVQESRKLGCHVMDRCNLTIIMANPKYADLPEFFARNKVQVISSLPYFSKTRTDSQRGEGVFEKSIEALYKLNNAGYGKPDSGLILDLVYNPSGAFLPGDQKSLENEFKRQLKHRFDIDFNSLYVITNLPISRFLDYLLKSDNYERYMTELADAFNPGTIKNLMCRNTLSISWDGFIYDCDFNQMLDLKIQSPVCHIDDFDLNTILQRKIAVNQHCFGCTAGAGSSCGGEIIK